MDKVRDARSSQNAINEQERVRRELRMKEEQALDEIKGNVRDYNSMLNSVLVEMDKLLRFLTKISNIKGTVYLEELRQMDMGIVSVADDVQRYRKMQDRLGEIFKLEPARRHRHDHLHGGRTGGGLVLMQDLAEWALDVGAPITDEVVEWFDERLALLQERPLDQRAVILEFFEK
jgi:hypothetical protein